MPQLTALQKSIIQTRLTDGGATIRQIADELNVNKNTILLAKRKILDAGHMNRRQGSGRKITSDAHQDNQLVDFLRENTFKTAIRAEEVTVAPR